MGCGLSAEFVALEGLPKKNQDSAQQHSKHAKRDVQKGSKHQNVNRSSYLQEPGLVVDNTLHLDVGDELSDEEDSTEQIEEFDLQWRENMKTVKTAVVKETLQKAEYADARKVLAKKYKSDDPFWNAFNLLHGNPYIETRSDVKIVRIFTSSTFTDTRTERNALMTDVYPKLKGFCKRQGYEFQVVDMRWGVRSEAEDDHRTTDFCLRELAECQKLSTGPNFVTFLSHKYGYQPIPRVVESAEFEIIIRSLNEEDQAFLLTWYRKDENMVPASHILQPITTILPDYLSQDNALKNAAKNEWWNTFTKLRKLLLQGVDQNIEDEKRRHFFHQSVTEDEIAHGILTQEKSVVAQTCFWFKRNIKNIEKVAKDVSPEDERKLQYYYDGEKNQEAASLLPDLKNKKIPTVLEPDSVKEYEVPWDPSGIETSLPEHRTYIENLCRDFETEMQKMIMKGIEERQKEEINDDLYFEVVQHVNFGRAKSAQFSGRDSFVQKIKSYVKSSNRAPLILHGDSGSGKTSLVAMAANLSFDWLDGKCAVIYRFLGTTQSSSSLRPLMHSLVGQLQRLYVSWKSVPNKDLKDLILDFKDLMKKVKKDKPLVLFLDSLDQLDDSEGGRNLHWLPRTLPANVKIIMSCLPQNQYKVFDKLKGLYPKDSCYLEISPMLINEVDNLLDFWLAQSQRALTKTQKDHLMAACALCPVPLFYKLSFDEALRWYSWQDVSSIKDTLQITVRETIKALFDRVGKTHGELLVSFALGCLTVAKSGLSEGEIEDLLSLNDEVLNDVYQFWEPPVRRLPPLLWVRVRHDLQEYITTRGVDGVRVITWYHRQFWETAYDKYLAKDDVFRQIHTAIAEYFLGTWSDKPKPYTDRKGESKSAFRAIAKEPLKYSAGSFNLRKINQLPFHLTMAGDLDQLKKEIVFNNDFLLAKLQAAGFSAVMEDLTLACRSFPSDKEMFVLKETLQLSQDALISHPEELASQLVGRIHGTGSKDIISQAEAMLDDGTLPPEAIEVLNLLQTFEAQQGMKNKNIQLMLNKLGDSEKTVLLPHRGFLAPPGGQLLYKLGGHSDIVMDMDITGDEKTIATGSIDMTAKVWNISSGDLLQSFDLPSEVGYVRFCNKDAWLAASCENKVIQVLDVANSSVLHELHGPTDESDLSELCMPIAVCKDGKHGEVLVCMRNVCIDIWKLSNGKKIVTMKNHLDDWSVHHQGDYMNYRHLLSNGPNFVYSSYRGTEFFTANLENISEEDPANMVEVFDAYDYDKAKEDTDFTPRSMDHICAMAITGDGKDVLICNGLDVKLHIFDLDTGDKKLIIDFKGNARMRACSFVTPEEFYFCNKNNVGVMNVGTQEAHSILPHPCRVMQVRGTKGPHVVTIAEDAVIRVWDTNMEPFQINLSEFTGKVKVEDNTAAFASFSNMFKSITGKNVQNLNASDVLTTENVENYWTKEVKTDEFDELVTSKANTTFLPMSNKHHVAVLQSHPMNQTAFCFSVWDTTHMICVKRLFFPQDSVYVFMVYQDHCLLVAEKDTMKIYDLKQNKVWKTFNGKMCTKHKPTVVLVHLKNEIITESEDGLHLVVYDVSKAEVRGKLQTLSEVHSHYKENKRSPKSRFSEIKVNQGGTIVGARVSDDRILLWDLQSLTMKHTICIKEPKFELLPVKNSTYAFQLTQNGHHLVLTRDNFKVYADAKDTTSKTSVIFIDVQTGNLAGHAAPYAKNQQHTMIIKQPMAFVRQFRRRLLQIVGVGNDGKFYTVAEEPCGRYTSSVKANGSFDRLVTWSPLPRERTIKLWSYENNTLNFLASFTPDKEATDIGMPENGRQLFINNSCGVIKLNLTGKNMPAENANDKDQLHEPLFETADLDAIYQVSQEEKNET